MWVYLSLSVQTQNKMSILNVYKIRFTCKLNSNTNSENELNWMGGVIDYYTLHLLYTSFTCTPLCTVYTGSRIFVDSDYWYWT